MEQNFDLIPSGQTGTVGKVFSGFNPNSPEGRYGHEGRWGQFGIDLGFPKIQSEVQRGGNAVELTRVQDQVTHVLYGMFNPIMHVSGIVIEFNILITDNAGLSVTIGQGNEMAAGVLLRSVAPGIRIWNPDSKAWVTMQESPRNNEWLKVVMDCNVPEKICRTTLFDEHGTKLTSQDAPFDSALLADAGLNNLVFNPQLPGACYIDNVSIKTKP